jgi:hypothetical protein
MKKSMLIAILGICFLSAKSQTLMPGEMIAGKIAQKMKDTLILTSGQKDQIYTVNMQLAIAKNNVRQQYSNMDSIRVRIQRLENSRDSLYHPVLTENQFLLYQQNKRNLVNNN